MEVPMSRPPDRERAAAAAETAAGDLTGVGADSPTSIPLGGSGASDLTDLLCDEPRGVER